MEFTGHPRLGAAQFEAVAWASLEHSAEKYQMASRLAVMAGACTGGPEGQRPKRQVLQATKELARF
jgi:hypothetical protein